MAMAHPKVEVRRQTGSAVRRARPASWKSLCRGGPRSFCWCLLALGMALAVVNFLFLQVLRHQRTSCSMTDAVVSLKHDVTGGQSQAVSRDLWAVVYWDDVTTEPLLEKLPPYWGIVVVGNNKPRDCSQPRCWHIASESSLPEKERTGNVKMAAFLHVIKHGATFVLVPSLDIPASHWLDGYHVVTEMSGLVYADSPFFDPELFYCPKRRNSQRKKRRQPLIFNVTDVTRPLIQHRVTTSSGGSDVTSKDAAVLSPVMVGGATFAPFSLAGSLVSRDALWALPFFGVSGVKGSGRVFGSLVAERLLLEVDAHVAFLAPYEFQKRTAGDFRHELTHASDSPVLFLPQRIKNELPQFTKHGFNSFQKDKHHDVSVTSEKRPAHSSDLKRGVKERAARKVPKSISPAPSAQEVGKENASHSKTKASSSHRRRLLEAPDDVSGNDSVTSSRGSAHALISFLQQWRCPPFVHFRSCALQLLSDLESADFLSKPDSAAIRHFLQRMTSLGYQFPIRRVTRRAPRSPVTFALHSPPSDLDTLRKFKVLNSHCPGLPPLTSGSPVIDDVMLVVVFNEARWYRKNLRFLQELHRPYFRHVTYCGPNTTHFRSEVLQLTSGEGVTHVLGLAGNRTWLLMYECTAYAMLMNQGVKGYLQVGDDTLVNAWNVAKLPKEQIWLPAERRTHNLSHPRGHAWKWWNSGYGGVALNRVLAELDRIYVTSADARMRSLAGSFLHRFYTNARSFTTAYSRGADFFYIPDRLRQEFLFAAGLFLEHDVMVEMAVVNMVLGMDLQENIHFFEPDGSLWYSGERYQLEAHYSESNLFLHPFKTWYFGTKNGTHFFCEVFMKHFAWGLHKQQLSKGQ